MKSSVKLIYICYFLIIIGIATSSYLLIHHFNVVTGKLTGNDLCSLVFGHGCIAAAFSKYSVFLHIPVGGWGLLYLIVLGSLIIQSQIFDTSDSNEIMQAAFWISAIGSVFSIFFICLMILVPALFCPFCTLFHCTNLSIFILLKIISNRSFANLFKDLFYAIQIVLLGKTMQRKSNKLKILSLIISLILGISVYQWVVLQSLKIQNDKLVAYDPLKEVEEFESKEITQINISENDPVLGPINAPVTLTVFSDFQCTMCEMFATNFHYLIAYNKEKLNIRFKHFPLSSECNPLAKENFHPLACEAAIACEAARLQGRFWEFHDSVFAVSPIKTEEQLFEIARKVKLDLNKFRNDYYSDVCKQKVNSDIQEGIRLKLDGTPSVYLNGRKITKLSSNKINFFIKFIAQ